MPRYTIDFQAILYVLVLGDVETYNVFKSIMKDLLILCHKHKTCSSEVYSILFYLVLI